jgi:hypothetical protein
MTTPIHFTQIDVEQEITSKIQQISNELVELRATGEVKINITSSTLFYLEALGYLVDFSTGLVTREADPACQGMTVVRTA